MSKFQALTLLLLTLILIVRIKTIGGIEKYEGDPELEEVAAQFEEMRFFLTDQIRVLLPQPQAALLSGIVLGVKEELPSDFKKALRATSTMHIVVVSGQNLTLLAGMIMNLAYLLGRRKTLALTLLAMFFYTLLTGLQIPVIRAVLMVGLGALAQFFNRQADSWWILLVVGGAMLIYHPHWLTSISFQLSFLATIGVVVVAPELIKRLTLIPEIIKQDLGVTVAAQLMVLPIIASNFHQVSLVGIVVNSLILWTVPLIMISGAASLAVSLISFPLGQLASIFPGILLTFFANIINLFSYSWSSFFVAQVSGLVWLGYYVLILGLFLILKKVNDKDEESALF